MKINIGNKEYDVKEAKTLEELEKGLKGIEELPENEGMLFYMSNKLSQLIFTMEGVKIPLDIIFINQDEEVVDVRDNCKPEEKRIVSSTENMEEDDYIAYVLEVNPKSGIEIGDILDLNDDEGPVMKVLALDGSTLMELWSGERIFRRAFTKQLIKWCKKAEEIKNDEEALNKIYKRIGKKMFKEIKALDNRPAEYVKAAE